jgi:hypothetical protein
MADHSSSSDARDDSPPTTPTAPSRTQKTNRAHNSHPTQHDTFFDDTTPVDNEKSEQPDHMRVRDSHDLSYAENSRDSVVDNMLLSLDQLPAAMFSDPAMLYSSFENDDFLLTENHYPPPRPARHRGHTYASSQSSDYDLHIDDTSSRYSSHHSHGRRSNSSNNIPSQMSRKGSLRGGYPNVRDKPSNSMYGEFQQTSHSRSGGAKGSKSSGSSSMDFGAAGVVGTHRLGFGNRSASFDQGNARGLPSKTESLLDRSRTAHQNYHHDYDAAPEPTIPGGPRRVMPEPLQSPIAYPPPPSYAPPQAPLPRRKGSLRSTTSRTLRKNKSHAEPNMRMQAQEFVNASNLRDLPPIPAYQDPPAPSPTVATRKHLLAPPLTPLTIPKEKPGFFRRVFGGGNSRTQPPLSNASSNSNTSHLDSSPGSSYTRPTEIEPTHSNVRPRTTPSSSNHIASQLKSMPKVPQTANSGFKESQQPAPPTLSKKSSSFFRRRKKSITDSSVPPVMALEFRPSPKQENLLLAQPSPSLSSLRKVMDPYFNDLGTTADRYHDAREHRSESRTAGEAARTMGEKANGFSPGYKPHQNATVRTVKPGSRENDSARPSSRGEQVKTMHALGNNSPKLKLKMKHGKSAIFNSNAQEETFLADSSSCNEDRSGRVTPSGVDETRRPRTSPTTTSFEPFLDGKSNRDRIPGISNKRAETLGPESAKTRGIAPVAGTSPSQSASEVEDEGWVITSPAKVEQASGRKKNSSRSKRVWLEPTSSEENLDDAEHMALPLEGAPSSQTPFEKESPTPAESPAPMSDVFHSATSLPIVNIESHDSESDGMPAILEHHPQTDDKEPTEADRTRARMIFTGDDPAGKAQAATILGDVSIASERIRQAYFELFDWSGFNILSAMRDLCGKLVLKAETQQVDRILMSLSTRWCECNPNHGFKAMGKNNLPAPCVTTSN